MDYTASVSTDVPTARNAPPPATILQIRDGDGRLIASRDLGGTLNALAKADVALEALGYGRTSTWDGPTWGAGRTATVAKVDR